MSGIDVTREVKAKWPQVEILIFTIFDEEDKVLEAVKAGASGYLLKGTPADKIIEAIKEVRAGGTVIQPSLARRLLRHFRVEPDSSPVPTEPVASPPPPAAPEPAPAAAEASEPLLKPLSNRETELLQLIAKGVSNSEAARLLNLSKATIRTHLEHIYRKLEVTNRVEAVTEGIRKGLISV
jgi:DNA-binding NarL/FixJ family response regulator